MHLKCVSLTIGQNLVHFLIIISIALKTTYCQQKESIPEFDNFPLIDSDPEASDEYGQQRPDAWIEETSRSSISVGNAGFARVLPKFSSADDAVHHVINSGVIEGLETDDLEKISKQYNNHYESIGSIGSNDNTDNYDMSNSNGNESPDNNNNNYDNNNSNNEYENQELRSRKHKNRLMTNAKLLERLLDIYKLKSSGGLAKRGEGPQLSIVNPLDVLRQRLLLELARRRMRENQEQIQVNAEILKKIGKRSIASIETIPDTTVHQSPEAVSSRTTTHNRDISDRSRRSHGLLNRNTNKSFTKCQKSRRKRGLNRLFLDK